MRCASFAVLVSRFHKLPARLMLTQSGETVAAKTVTFRAKAPKRKR